MTTATVAEREVVLCVVVLCVGDTTFLDYGKIVVKREGYGPTGNGGNGLIQSHCPSNRPTLRSTIGTVVAKAVESRAEI